LRLTPLPKFRELCHSYTTTFCGILSFAILLFATVLRQKFYGAKSCREGTKDGVAAKLVGCTRFRQRRFVALLDRLGSRPFTEIETIEALAEPTFA